MFEQAKQRGRRVGTRVRSGQRRLKRISQLPTLGGIFLSFLKIGVVGFGGGLAVMAQIRTLVVKQRRWFTDHEFAECFALAQSLPGTNAGNAATYVGFRLRGWRGAAVAMAGFILPSMLMMIVLAILYRHLRNFPDTDRLFHGLNAAVVAVIVVTAWRIGRNTLTKPWQWYVTVLSAVAVIFFGATIIEVVLTAGLIGIYIDSFAEKRWQRWRRIRRLAARRRARLAEIEEKNFVGGYLTRALAEERVRRLGDLEEEETEDDTVGPSVRLRSSSLLLVAMPIMAKLGLLLALSAVFLRMGTVTFGGGFVMIPQIEAEVVRTNHWLTRQEFADATALGQITPGPVLITATFIGYRVAGTLGALVATITVFLPAFIMTIAAGSSLRRFRANRQVQSFLRGVTPAVVGLLGAAAWSIGHAGIHTWLGLSLAVVAAIVLLRFRLNPFWVILGAGVTRFVAGLILGL
ncbi:MAG TPA: chromate transporter [Pyrinomonadaceae bacterium]|nr:chromate transporter [Pyrinomonadaceae bacterium]